MTNAATPVSKTTRDPSALLAARRANVAALMAKLAEQADAAVAGGTWGHAGDLGRIEEVLLGLVQP